MYFVHPSTDVSVDISTDISVECRLRGAQNTHGPESKYCGMSLSIHNLLVLCLNVNSWGSWDISDFPTLSVTSVF